MLPQMPADELLGSLLAYRAVYYVAPLVVGALLFAGDELRAQRGHLKRAQVFASAYVTPVVPQVVATLSFVAGGVLLLSGATPGVDDAHRRVARALAACDRRGVAPRR